MKELHLRFLSYLVIAYMLLAFGWWSVLLFKKNEDAFLAKAEYLKLVMKAKNEFPHTGDFKNSPAYKQLSDKYKRQEWMIFGEASVFILSLAIGIYLINRAYHREMQSAKSRRNFLLSITHELKSPIASIRLVLETFLKRNLKQEQVHQLSKGGLQETERLHKLVNDLLLAARVETAYQPQLEELDLKSLISELIEQVQYKWPNAQFSIEASEKEYSVHADQMGMASVVLNLLENAIKYSPEPAKINIKLNEVKQAVVIEVADQGYGIKDQDKKKVFDRFYRIGSEDTRTTKGTGLGLYIVSQIVKAHGGKVSVRDNEASDSGAVFEVLIPRREQKMDCHVILMF